MTGEGEKVGVLVISYGSRAAAMIDALCRSTEHDVQLFVADKQRNPFNIAHAAKHRVIPDLAVDKVVEFVAANKDAIDFGLCGPEKPIIAGVRDRVERETGVPMICPTQQFAIEESKVGQRYLIEKCCPEANPRFQVFDPSTYRTLTDVKDAVWRFLDEIGDEVAVKPDRPTAGKGVGVWGDHFSTREQLFAHFQSIYETGSAVLVEEKLDGEESSFQAFCDGKRIAALPDTRDYKRAFDHDLGPNTGGMGSFKAADDWLPFLTPQDRATEERLAQLLFDELRGGSTNDGLRGLPFYIAFMHTADGAKILEINSRPGDPEIMNIMPVLKDDFVDLCYRMINGTLNDVACEQRATVVTYAVPMDYGEYRRTYSGSKLVDLSPLYALQEQHGDNLRVYPGSMELRENGETFALGSRAVGTVGIGETLEEAREISLEGIRSIDGALWNRWDIAAPHYIERSKQKMQQLRG